MTSLPQIAIIIWNGFWLLLFSYNDLKTRSIPLWEIILYLIGFPLISGYILLFSPDLIARDLSVHGILFGIATVSFLFLLKQFLSQFQFETADIIILSGTLASLGLGRGVLFGTIFTIAGILISLTKKTVKLKIPFAPLLLLSYTITIAIWELVLKSFFIN